MRTPTRGGRPAQDGPTHRHVRSASRRRRRRQPPQHPPSVAAAPASVSTSQRPGRALRPATVRRAAPCAGGRPVPLSWDPHARGAAIDDGSGRWTRPPGAHQIAAKRSGLTPPPREALRRPTGSQSSLPDDLPSLWAKTLVNEPLQMVDGGEMPQRRPRRHFSCRFGCTPRRPDESRASLARPSSSHRRRSAARLHQRPSVQPTVTAQAEAGRHARRGDHLGQRARSDQFARRRPARHE